MSSSPDTPHHAHPVDRPFLPPAVSWAIMLGLGLGIWAWDVLLDRRPEGVDAKGWQLLAVFLPTILGLMLRPLAGGAIVLIALTVTMLTETLTAAQALGGYADKSVWLVLAAYFISRAIIKTGLARRIALNFVRLIGKNTLGLSYSLVATDTVLAGMIPSNAARLGGVILPITRSLAELYRSFPGKTAGMLGTFLMLTIFQADMANCAMYITGQASNPIAADLARKATDGAVNLNYGSWLWYACVPGLVSVIAIPFLIYVFARPEIKHTPEAVDMARRELAAMGPMDWREIVVMLVFAGTVLAWIIDGRQTQGAYTTAIALAAAGVLLLSGVLTWEDAMTEKAAWDVFIWYGGLVQLGLLLEGTKIPKVFAESIAGGLDLPMLLLFVVTLLIYFYAHYAFASITAHVSSMYVAFVSVLLVAKVPMGLAACSFAFITNLSAGLTHYATTPAPIIFNTHYVSVAQWWKTGFFISLVNLTIWLTVGLAWWKLLGLW